MSRTELQIKALKPQAIRYSVSDGIRASQCSHKRLYLAKTLR